MPAKTKDTRKLRSHRSIESAAARLLRREGTTGASVRKVMTEAGLTIGGFYAHFPSKDGLIRDAFSAAIAQRRRFVAKALGDSRGADVIDRFLEVYLTREHRDNRETGCPYAALLSDLPRSSRAVRSRARDEFSASVKGFADSLDERAPEEARAKAIAVLSLSFGALALARAFADYPEGDEVLAAAAAASKYFTGRAGREGTA